MLSNDQAEKDIKKRILFTTAQRTKTGETKTSDKLNPRREDLCAENCKTLMKEIETQTHTHTDTKTHTHHGEGKK